MPGSETARGLSARAVLRRPADGSVLLLRRSPGSTHFPGLWEFPGGKPDANENFAGAVTREVREETGLEFVPGAVAGFTEGRVGSVRVLYLFIEGETGADEPVLSPEHDRWRWVGLPELARLGSLPTPEEGGSRDSGEDRLVPHFRDFALDYARRHGYQPSPRGASASAASAEAGPGELAGWVAEFRDARERFEALGRVLSDLMEELVRPHCPTAVIAGRTKGVGSFARKILTKGKYRDPLSEITDLHGLRVVTQIGAEVETVRRILRSRGDLFVIDEKNSEDKLTRLRRGEFGYRSVHFVIGLAEGAVPEQFRSLRLHELRAEVQIRTQLQHAWADIGHDRLYKAAFVPPGRFERESARIAALLETADEAFSRLVSELDDYEGHFGSYLDTAGIREQIAVQHAILEHDPGNAAEVLRLARLHLALGSPGDSLAAAEVVKRIPPPLRTADLWCALGHALRQREKNPASPGLKEAREAYGEAVRLQPGHQGAMVGLAEASATDQDKLDAYAAAHLANPDDPQTLSGYLRQKIRVDRDLGFLPLLRASLLAAIAQCRKQIEVKVDLPWAYYRLAGFQMLLGGDAIWEGYETLARAIRCDSGDLPLMLAALEATSDLLEADPAYPGARESRCVLLAALRVKHRESAASAPLEDLVSSPAPLAGPVVIVAGGCDAAQAGRMEDYRSLLLESLRGFRGTVISGGTREGVAGIVGEVGARSDSGEPAYAGIGTVGYLPSHLPTDGTATVDDRYRELRRTAGTSGFSVMEPVQYWIDLLASGIDPGGVRVVGINGGRIAGFEYLLAWALGAEVALVRDSGRIADSFEGGIGRGDFAGMLVLPHDPMSLQAFLQGSGGTPNPLSGEARERLARYAHALFLEGRRHEHSDPAMQPWEALRGDLRESNLNQVDHMVRHLEAKGFRIVPRVPGTPVFEFGPEDEAAVEAMAMAEHGRWNLERISQGWSHGPGRDVGGKVHRGLVAWDQLDEASRDWDRQVVRRYPEMLAQAGLAISRCLPAPGC